MRQCNAAITELLNRDGNESSEALVQNTSEVDYPATLRNGIKSGEFLTYVGVETVSIPGID